MAAELVPVKDKFLWKVSWRGGTGGIPKELQTAFSSEGAARKAIELFKAGRDNKIANSKKKTKVKTKEE